MEEKRFGEREREIKKISGKLVCRRIKRFLGVLKIHGIKITRIEHKRVEEKVITTIIITSLSSYK